MSEITKFFDLMRDKITKEVNTLTEKHLQIAITNNGITEPENIKKETIITKQDPFSNKTQWFYEGLVIMERTLVWNPEGPQLDIKTFKRI